MGGWTHRWTAGWNDGSLELTVCGINWVLDNSMCRRLGKEPYGENRTT